MDDELMALRQRLESGSNAAAVPSGEEIAAGSKSTNLDNEVERVKVSEVDNELEELRRSIDNL